jgi:hypothetical protein
LKLAPPPPAWPTPPPPPPTIQTWDRGGGNWMGEGEARLVVGGSARKRGLRTAAAEVAARGDGQVAGKGC